MQLADIVAALDELPATAYEGPAYRHVSANRPALSGEGARLIGGRWNPPGSFAVLYVAFDIPTTVRELLRLAARQGRTSADFLPRDLITYEIGLQHVIDLRSETHAQAVGLDCERMRADDPGACRLVGEAAHQVGFEAVLAPSATGHGDIAAIFLDRTLPGSTLKDTARTRWEDVSEP